MGSQAANHGDEFDRLDRLGQVRLIPGAHRLQELHGERGLSSTWRAREEVQAVLWKSSTEDVVEPFDSARDLDVADVVR
jgi:hypothetical protein